MVIMFKGTKDSCSANYGDKKPILSLGRFFFFFFFCNHAFIVSRYKKPHAALAMERTKPINQKHKQKKVTAPVKYPLSAQVSPPPGQRPHITRKVQPTTQSSSKESLPKYKGKIPKDPIPQLTKKHEKPGGAPWGVRERTGGKRGEWWVGTSWGEIPWRLRL